MTRIITDSTSDLTKEQQVALGIDIIPLTVLFGEDSYLDGVTLSHQQFYEKLAVAESLPTTAQIPPETFISVFREYVDAGDEVVGLFLSSEMSGTTQSANIARMAVSDTHIFIVDSRTVTFGLGAMVIEATKMRDNGLSAAEIAAELVNLSQRIHLVAAVDTLKYLKMGGRISATTAMVGGLLGINPTIAVQHGVVESIGKVRGRKAAFKWVAQRVTEQEPIDFSHAVVFGHSNALDALEECKAAFAGKLDDADLHTSDIGCVVGAHVGPGAAGIAYFLKK